MLAQAIHGRDPRLPGLRRLVDAENRRNEDRIQRRRRQGRGLGRPRRRTIHARASPWIGNCLEMQALFRQWDPQTTMKCVIFEENGESARYAARARPRRHAQRRAAARRLCARGLPRKLPSALAQNDNGWDQGQVFFTPDHVWAMPPFYAQQMAAENYEPLRVQSDVSGADLDVTAIGSEDGKTLVLSVVNSDGPQAASFSLTGFAGVQSPAHAWTLPQTSPPSTPRMARKPSARRKPYSK